MTPSAILESALYVGDLKAAEEFYRDVLGLEVITRAEGRHVFFRCGDGVLLLFNADATEVPPAPGREAAGAAAWRARSRPFVLCRDAPRRSTAGRRICNRSGVAIEADFEWPNGGRSIYFRDPSGNSLEFAEPRIWGL